MPQKLDGAPKVTAESLAEKQREVLERKEKVGKSVCVILYGEHHYFGLP